MMTRWTVGLWVSLAAVACLWMTAAVAQNATALEAEVRRLEERIAAAQRDSLEKYEAGLQELQTAAQKAADLETSLALRDEFRRVTAEGKLTEKHLLPSPKSARTLQQQTMERMQDLVSHLVQESLPKLIELKKTLTIAGRLDEALGVRKEIERLQESYLPLVPASDSTITTIETLLTAYGADRARADKVFKGRRIIVRGLVGGHRAAPDEKGAFHLFLTGPNGGGWVQAQLGAELRPREERGRSGTVLAMTTIDNETVRVQKGQTFDLRAVCEGFDETVRLSKCEPLR